MTDNDITVAKRHTVRRDWIALLLFAIVWLAFCLVFGTDDEALLDPVQVRHHLLLQVAKALTSGNRQLAMVFTCAVFLGSVPVLAWFLSRRPVIAVAASLAVAVGWIVFVNVNVWCMYLEDPEPDALGSGTPAALVCAAQHIAMAYVLLLIAKWVRKRTRCGTGLLHS